MHEMIFGRAASKAANGAQQRFARDQGESNSDNAFAKTFDGAGKRGEAERRARPETERPDSRLNWVSAKPVVAANSQSAKTVQPDGAPTDVFVFSTELAVRKAQAANAAVELPAIQEETALSEGTVLLSLSATYGGSAKETEFFEEFGESENPSVLPNAEADVSSLGADTVPSSAPGDLQHLAVAPASDKLGVFIVPQTSANVETVSGPLTPAMDPALHAERSRVTAEVPHLPAFESRYGQRSGGQIQRSEGASTGANSTEKAPGLLSPEDAEIYDAPAKTAVTNGELARDWNWFRSAMSERSSAMSDAKLPEQIQSSNPGQAAANMIAHAPDLQFVSQRGKVSSGSDITLSQAELIDSSLRPTTPITISQPMTAAPPVAQQVFAQIAIAVEQAKTNEIEITLDPEELGKVRIVLAPREGGYDITVIASREQTLEMMRRFGSDLSSSFAELGYEHTDLNFESSDQNGDPEGEKSGGESAAAEDLPEERTSQIIVARTGLDLKV